MPSIKYDKKQARSSLYDAHDEQKKQHNGLKMRTAVAQ